MPSIFQVSILMKFSLAPLSRSALSCFIFCTVRKVKSTFSAFLIAVNIWFTKVVLSFVGSALICAIIFSVSGVGEVPHFHPPVPVDVLPMVMALQSIYSGGASKYSSGSSSSLSSLITPILHSSTRILGSCGQTFVVCSNVSHMRHPFCDRCCCHSLLSRNSGFVYSGRVSRLSPVSCSFCDR